MPYVILLLLAMAVAVDAEWQRWQIGGAAGGDAVVLRTFVLAY